MQCHRHVRLCRIVTVEGVLVGMSLADGLLFRPVSLCRQCVAGPEDAELAEQHGPAATAKLPATPAHVGNCTGGLRGLP